MPTIVADIVAILGALELPKAHVVGHDWGAAAAWFTAMYHPDRVDRLVMISVGHPGTRPSIRQREMAWYQLFFQFEGIAEQWLQHDDRALFRQLLRGDGDLDQCVSDLSRPDALTASLNWYPANLAPRPPGTRRDPPPVTAPTMGIWSTGDHYLDGERMRDSAQLVEADWRYEEVDGASHWIPLDAPDLLTEILLDWIR
jgi:pimeloyl-ACP methyl ester carboxylesterase